MALGITVVGRPLPLENSRSNHAGAFAQLYRHLQQRPGWGLLAVVVGGNHGEENYMVLGLWVHFREETIP